MKVKITEGMRFKHVPFESGNEFVVESYDYYGDGEPILCACTDKFICPLDEVYLENYVPMVNDVWVNEHCEYEC